MTADQLIEAIEHEINVASSTGMHRDAIALLLKFETEKLQRVLVALERQVTGRRAELEVIEKSKNYLQQDVAILVRGMATAEQAICHCRQRVVELESGE